MLAHPGAERRFRLPRSRSARRTSEPRRHRAPVTSGDISRAGRRALHRRPGRRNTGQAREDPRQGRGDGVDSPAVRHRPAAAPSHRPPHPRPAVPHRSQGPGRTATPDVYPKTGRTRLPYRRAEEVFEEDTRLQADHTRRRERHFDPAADPLPPHVSTALGSVRPSWRRRGCPAHSRTRPPPAGEVEPPEPTSGLPAPGCPSRDYWARSPMGSRKLNGLSTGTRGWAVVFTLVRPPGSGEHTGVMSPGVV